MSSGVIKDRGRALWGRFVFTLIVAHLRISCYDCLTEILFFSGKQNKYKHTFTHIVFLYRDNSISISQTGLYSKNVLTLQTCFISQVIRSGEVREGDCQCVTIYSNIHQQPSCVLHFPFYHVQQVWVISVQMHHELKPNVNVVLKSLSSVKQVRKKKQPSRLRFSFFISQRPLQSRVSYFIDFLHSNDVVLWTSAWQVQLSHSVFHSSTYQHASLISREQRQQQKEMWALFFPQLLFYCTSRQAKW